MEMGGMDTAIDSILREQSAMEANRGTFEGHWQEVAERLHPRMAIFHGLKTDGSKNSERIFDGTAPLALERFASAVNGYVTPSNQRYQGLETNIPELNDNHEVREWCEEATDIIFNLRYSDLANFDSQMQEIYMSLGAFGTGCMFIDEIVGQGVMYKSIPLNEVYICENHQGMIDRVHRKFQMTARNIKAQFPKATLPEKVETEARDRPNTKFWVLHCVYPNPDRKEGDRSYRGMKYVSRYLLQAEKHELEIGGYRSFPYAISRYVTQPGEIYGRGPGMTVLGDIKVLNEMQKTILRAAHLATDPPILLFEDGALSGFKMKPSALNFGGLDAQGREMAKPFQSGAKFDLGFEMQEQKRKLINDAFLLTLFQILVDAPKMTAYEVMTRMQEKGQLIGPVMGRQRKETLSVVTARELDIAEANGILPPRPQVMLDMGARVRIAAKGPLERLQRAEEGAGILRTLEAITPLAQIDQAALAPYKIEKISRTLAEINGVPADCMYSEEELEEKAAEDQQQAELAQLIQAAPLAGKAAKDMAQAQQITASTPTQGLPALAIE
jgi:hypothetical protein